MPMQISAIKHAHLVILLVCWLGAARDWCVNTRHTLQRSAASKSGIFHLAHAQELTPEAPKGEANLYEGVFDLPANGADPFSMVAVLRANAAALKESHISKGTIDSITELVVVLIQDEGVLIQLQNDLWLMEETKRSVDVLQSNPSQFPSTGYSLREGTKGELYVRTEVPFWMVDAETGLALIVQDLMRDVIGMRLPRTQNPLPGRGDSPIEFGYDPTMSRTVKLLFGYSVVTVTSGVVLNSGGATGVSHGSYNVTIGAGENSTETEVSADPVEIQSAAVSTGPVELQSSISSEGINQKVSIGDVSVQNRVIPSIGTGSVVAGYKDFNFKVITDPMGKRHGAEAKTKDFTFGVTRDFDDRITHVRHRSGDYSWHLDTDMADDRNHAYYGTITTQAPLTGTMVFGGGFDATNNPTSTVAFDVKDVGIAFSGTRGQRDYTVRIGPFVFNVSMSGGLPEFILREIKKL